MNCMYILFRIVVAVHALFSWIKVLWIRNLFFSLSDSCVHVSAILHALEDLFSPDKLSETVTTGCCSWLDPRPKKVSPLPTSDLRLEKHVWAHSKSRQFKKVETFNPFNSEARSQHFHQQSSVNMVSDGGYISTTLMLLNENIKSYKE